MKREKILKILMLEDMEEDAELIERTLRKGEVTFSHIRVETREDFIANIHEFRPDVILSDHTLPQFNSIEALGICKDLNLFIPFILVTGTISEEFAVSCIKRGADDYILKSNLSRLPVAIQNALKQKKLEQSRIETALALKKQNAELRTINAELDSFAYNVSHSLRAPLRSVLGLINLVKLEEKHGTGKSAELINMMEYNVEKLDATLKNILDHSRNARINNTYHKIDLVKLIEDCYDDLKYLDGAELIQRDIHANNDCDFYSDKERLIVLINNLLSNSIKYKDDTKGNSRIDIDAFVTKENAVITFQDNGIGIEKEIIPRVFDMFFRGTQMSDGSGLGLYVAKGIVDKLSGSIDIKSTLNEGTTITIIIPNFIDQSSEPEKNNE